MFELLKESQLNVMLVLSGISAATAFFMALSKSLTRERKLPLMMTEIFTVLLLVFDRFAYLFRGDVSSAGYLMVRLSNFVVFAMTLLIVWAFNLYIRDIFAKDCGLETIPLRLKYADIAAVVGMILLLISQFTGFYYTFDENNIYHRSPGFMVGIVIIFSVMLIQLSVVVQYRARLRKSLFISLSLFTTLPLIAAFVQLKFYGLSLINITIGILTSLLYIFALVDMNETVERARKIEIDYLKAESEGIRRLFGQTAEALASAIDAKDKYTRGHSSRVAEYSRKIAELAGKDPQECEEVYYAALLHDVGKIGISNRILNKEGKLSDEEYEIIKQHPVIGEQILASISESPYLSIGAHAHHERYDGRGYPRGLKGEDIPEIARIIAVADAYDAMTSKRSYRSTIPQQMVREEFVKGTGTQFDPVFAKIMIHLIDIDGEYSMKEKEEVRELAGKNELVCEEFRSAVSEGIIVTPEITRIKLTNTPEEGYPAEKCIPTIILFDSLDARMHDDEKNIKRLLYFEYGEIRFDGRVECRGARKIQPKILSHGSSNLPPANGSSRSFEIEAVKVKDHVLIRIISESETVEIITALPDSTRYAYIGLTGERCHITDVSIKRDEEPVAENYIPRIAEEISYIDVPSGDIPNVQVDGYRSAATEGLLINDELTISFHTMSLPTARLVWHCPFFSIFSSKTGRTDDPSFTEYALIRLDGENWESDDHAVNKIVVNHSDDFAGWDNWKKQNKEGLDCVITVKREGKKITFTTENAGIGIVNTTILKNDEQNVYISLTGDQCALTNIKIRAKDDNSTGGK